MLHPMSSEPIPDTKPAPADDIAAMSFEAALAALEDVVGKLESGDVPLEASIDLYARGEALRKHCQTRLDSAQARIETIVRKSDGSPLEIRPFDSDG